MSHSICPHCKIEYKRYSVFALSIEDFIETYDPENQASQANSTETRTIFGYCRGKGL